ncbi:MAG TPA: polysaccharide deacetylase family protein [Elusimicrobiota bacterium]|nr:polysaccharide deacetylase family protein [Elusimicrobiota bacterium]
MKFPRPRLRVVIRRYHVILTGSILLLTGAVIPSGWEPPVRAMIPKPPDPVEPATPRHPWIALTFDDGPHPVLTEQLLQVLRDQRVPATFFVVGKMADRYPQLIQEIAQDGHEIENHTYTHRCMTHMDRETVMNELAQTRAVIRRLTGHDSILFRPPGGDYTSAMVRATSHAGYHMVLWSVLTNDVVGASRLKMMHRVETGAGDGGIILMHSGVKSTMALLPEMIYWLRGHGYHFVTVSTLLGLSSDSPYRQPIVPVMQTASRSRPTEHSTIQ